MSRTGRKSLIALAVLFVAAVPSLAGRASLAASTPASPVTKADGAPAQPLRLDPPFASPDGPVSQATKSQVGEVLAAQRAALLTGDLGAYLVTLGGPEGPDLATAAGTGVAGSPSARVSHYLFDPLQEASAVDFASVNPVFFSPGADGTVEVLARHLAGYRAWEGDRRLVEVDALERLRFDGRAWKVFDWTKADETAARETWTLWVDGRVTLEPFESRLRAEITYTFFPGYPAGDGDLAFELADTFEITRVHGENGDLPWRVDEEGFTVTLPPRSAAAETPTRVTVAYRGHVTPSGSPRRGNLEYLGGEGIYLRPASGWYPRPLGEGAVRGTLAVTVPGWWAAAVPGRLVAATRPGSIGEVRTFTWGLDLPAELYLAAGSYLVGDAVTARGVTVRTFFTPREAEWSAQYLAEAERILDFFSDEFAPYPYPNLTLAEVEDFYYGGLSARTFVLLEKDWLADPSWDAGARDLLAHEISHQWWGEMVSAQGEADWFLWEGLASYCEGLYAEEREGPGGLAQVMAEKAASYAGAVKRHAGWSIKQANVRTSEWQDAFVYDKGAWIFHTLRYLLGDDGFFGLMRTYLDLFAGREPSSADFDALVTGAAPGDAYLAEYVDRWVDQPGDPDLTVNRISLGRDGSLSFDLKDLGTGLFPEAEVKLVFAGGRSETVVCHAGRNVVKPPLPVRGLVVDPESKVLDLARPNNVWYMAGGFAVSRQTLEFGFQAVTGMAVAALGLVGFAHLRRRRRGRSGSSPAA